MNKTENDENVMKQLTLTGLMFSELAVGIFVWQLTDLNKLTDVLNLIVNLVVGGFIAMIFYVAIYLVFYTFKVPESTGKWTSIFYFVVPVALVLAAIITVLV